MTQVFRLCAAAAQDEQLMAAEAKAKSRSIELAPQ
jgi:hypothetical protein